MTTFSHTSTFEQPNKRQSEQLQLKTREADWSTKGYILEFLGVPACYCKSPLVLKNPTQYPFYTG